MEISNSREASQAEGAEPKAERGRSPINNERESLHRSLLQSLVNKFASANVNLNEKDLVFMTIHPYKKSKNFAKMQNVSKVSDIVRRKLTSYFLVKEKNSESDDCHYHLLGYLGKETMFSPKHMKIWMEKVVEKEAPKFTSQRELHDLLVNDQDNEKLDYDACMKANSKDIQKAFALSYWKAKRSVSQQVGSILNYMLKGSQMKLYNDYIVVGL